MIKYFVSFNTVSIEMSNQSFICESDNHGIGCGPPGCICIKLRSNKKEIACSYIGEIHKSTPDSSREVSEIGIDESTIFRKAVDSIGLG